MTKSKIEWTDRTWNPTVGCARVSPGCENCYAEKQAARVVLMSAAQGQDSVYLPVVDVERRRWNRACVTVLGRLGDPLRWKKPAMVFVNSMSDLFHDKVPFEFVAAVFGVAAACPQHTFQILTKRPQRAREFFRWVEEQADECAVDVPEYCHLAANEMLRAASPESAMWAAADDLMDRWTWGSLGPYGFEAIDDEDAKDIERRIAKAKRNGADDIDTEAWPLPNVWLGVSVEDQARADERIPVLLECPAALRFLSCEPLLGALDLSRWIFDRKAAIRRAMAGSAALNREQAEAVIAEVGIGWAIVGGESGPGARECDIGDVRSIVQQCKAADVPCFVKQLGARPVRRQPAQMGHGSMSQYEVETDDLVEHLLLTSRKGADPSEWPADLRVQEFPGGAK